MCNTRLFTVIIIAVSVTASLSCPPGFVPQGNRCVCADWPNGMVNCDEVAQKASMQIGYCMTYSNTTSEISVGSCAQSYFRNDSYKFYYPLPTEVSNLNDRVCGPSNTTGFLCGDCREGSAVSPILVTSIDCVNCAGTSSSWIKYFALTYLSITALFIVILTFSVSVVSGPVNSFIFFGQVTSVQFFNMGYIASVLEAQGTGTFSHRISTTVLAACYDIWNLNVFIVFIPTFCLTKHLSSLQAVALEYVRAVYPLILILILYICIKLHSRNFKPIVCCWKPFLKCFLRFRRSVNPKTSVIDVFATFMLLSYVKLLFVSGSILSPNYTYNYKGEKLSTVYVHYSPSIKYFHSKHLPFALLSIFVSLTFIAVPPIVLIFYPTSLFQKCLTKCKINSQALRTFVETFQGCYKDGTNGTRDCRYFAGLYFILRIIAVPLAFTNYQTFFSGSAHLYWITALLFALVQPYKKYMYNVIDAVIFAIMGSIYLVIMRNTEHVVYGGHASNPLLVLTDVLYSLPLLYFIMFGVWWMLNRKTTCAQKLRDHKLLRHFFQDQKESLEDTTVPHRLLNPEGYEPLDGESQLDYDAPLQVQNSNTYGAYEK